MAYLTTLIAVLSLVVSFASLYFSLKKSKQNERLISAQKRTELRIKVIDSKFRFEKQLSKIRTMKTIWETCDSCPKDKIESIENSLIENIKKIDEYDTFLSGLNDDADPLTLEKLIPHYYDLSQKAEDCLIEMTDIIKGCRSCQEKITSNESILDVAKD